MKDIYVITNKVNNKKYVGQTSVGYLKRFNRHCKSYDYGIRTLIAQAIHEYGKENFTVELIESVDDCNADLLEVFYIDKYKTHMSCGGYNMTYGGKSNPMDIDEICKKHKDAVNQDYVKERQRESSKNRVITDDTRQKLREFTLSHLDICCKGFREYNESRKIPVGMIVEEEIVMKFDSLSDACKYLNITDKSATAHIHRYADKRNKNGKRSKIYGYAWTLL